MHQCAYKIICESCEKTFYAPTIVHTVVCTDSAGTVNDNFINGCLNSIMCTECNKTFTYEIPMLVYSAKKSYAIVVLPSETKNVYVSKNSILNNILKLNINKFRLVNYQCEALEKVKIFESGLDDIIIERIKLNEFDKKYFENKNLHMLLFKEIYKDELIFEYKDFLGNIIETRNIAKELYNKMRFCSDTGHISGNKTNWLKIDTNYFKEN